ncbi:prenyltransferase/squalene oxidase repeat-containing protein [Rhodopirellula sallentina]|uniref:prenyltransferase/squalene oxidase repeat-containing protein n=1 Tax=Rhodopirellula sallentina TaxID=1263869 RepID=UPI001F1B8709|nr:prenyltransferase/squalene oxidase repeat-containing protein [Rhodopirellula sallentina]
MPLRRNFHRTRRNFVRATALAALGMGVLLPGQLVGQLAAQDVSTAKARSSGTTVADASSENAQVSESEKQRRKIVEKGLRFLAQQGQSDAGTFSDRAGPGVTALAITSALRNGHSLDEPMVAAGLKALEGYVKPDGGIYGNGRIKNYETCVAMVCFAEANKTGKYNNLLQRAKAFVTEMQYGGGERDPSDPWYGGVGYGGAGRPDLSNTAYMIEALRAAETEASDPAIQRALAFVSRCQNLDSEHNDTAFAAKVDDGGFYYEIPTTKIDPSTSDERYTDNGGLRSYGSMTYTGLKSMIFAGLTAEDKRVKAAVKWIGDHYTVEKNPGMGSAGLYYYYHTFAAALDAAGVQSLTDSDGKEHDWRADLIAELAERQNEDGSWSNENQRWFENDKNLATSFALMALAYCD